MIASDVLGFLEKRTYQKDDDGFFKHSGAMKSHTLRFYFSRFSLFFSKNCKKIFAWMHDVPIVSSFFILVSRNASVRVRKFVSSVCPIYQSRNFSKLCAVETKSAIE